MIESVGVECHLWWTGRLPPDGCCGHACWEFLLSADLESINAESTYVWAGTNPAAGLMQCFYCFFQTCGNVMFIGATVEAEPVPLCICPCWRSSIQSYFYGLARRGTGVAQEVPERASCEVGDLSRHFSEMHILLAKMASLGGEECFTVHLSSLHSCLGKAICQAITHWRMQKQTQLYLCFKNTSLQSELFIFFIVFIFWVLMFQVPVCGVSSVIYRW